MPMQFAANRPPGPGQRGASAPSLLALAFAAVVGFGGCAYAGPYNPEHLAPTQLSEVGQVCQSVMGLHPNEDHYDACVGVLSQSVRSVGEGRAMQRAHARCAEQGLEPGTPELATCVLARLEEAPPAPVEVAPSQALLTKASAAKSFFSTSYREHRRREREVCAMVGLDPASAAFARCVSGLSDAFAELDNPHD